MTRKKFALRKNSFTTPAVSTETDIREALSKAADNRGEISRIAKALGVSPSTVTRWIPDGIIPPPMLKLLALYFFGEMPFDIMTEKTATSVLEFTPDQWRVIGILAQKVGLTHGKWIAQQIRAYLTFDAEAQAAAKAMQPEFPALASLARVAEEPAPARAADQQHPVTYPKKSGKSK